MGVRLTVHVHPAVKYHPLGHKVAQPNKGSTTFQWKPPLFGRSILRHSTASSGRKDVALMGGAWGRHDGQSSSQECSPSLMQTVLLWPGLATLLYWRQCEGNWRLSPPLTHTTLHSKL